MQATHKTRWLTLSIFAIFIVGLFVPMISQNKHVAADDSLWVHGSPLKVTRTGSDNLGNFGNNDCYNVTFKVQRYKWLFNNWVEDQPEYKNVCAVQTPIGIVGGGYVQFPGTEFAQKLWNGGSDLEVVPVPGHKTLILGDGVAASIPHSNGVRFYYNALAAGESVIAGDGQRKFKITSWPEPLRDEQGKIMSIYNIAFSSSGEWALAVVGNAIIRIHTPTKSVQTIGRGYSGGGLSYGFAISNDGRYAFVQDGAGFYGNPYIFDLNGCIPNQSTAVGPDVALGCQRRAITSDLQSQVPGFRMLQGTRFSYDSQKITAIVRYQKASDTSYPSGLENVDITNQGYVQPKTAYLALGDSFASGEGDTEGGTWYEPGTDVSNNKCHVSRRSYPYLVANQLGLHSDMTESPADDSLFHSVACSGAQSEHILKKIQYDDVENAPYWMAGTKQQAFWVEKEQPDALTISMIGNDIGFGKIIARCMEPDTCYDSYEDRLELALLIGRKFNVLTQMYQELKSKSPASRIYVIGYPQIVSESGSCGLNVRLNQKEREFAVGLTHYLNAVIKAATENTGIQYVDIEDTLAGKELCSSEPQNTIAVNGITAGNDRFHVIGAESFHPNQTAHSLLATAVMQLTNGLTLPMPAADTNIGAPSPTSPQFTKLLNASRSGRELYDINYDDDLSNNIIYRGGFEQLVLDQVMPRAVQKLVLHSDPIDLGTFESDEEGKIDATFNVSADTPVGFHTLHLIGPGPAGNTVDIQKVVYVAASPDDFDGDGVLNQDEKCGILEPLNEDYDQDGIDDACDPKITEPPSEPETPGNDQETVPGDESSNEEPDELQGSGNPQQAADDDLLCYKLQLCNTESNPAQAQASESPIVVRTVAVTSGIVNSVVTARAAASSVVVEADQPQVQGVSTTQGSTAQTYGDQLNQIEEQRAGSTKSKSVIVYLVWIVPIILAALAIGYVMSRAKRRY